MRFPTDTIIDAKIFLDSPASKLREKASRSRWALSVDAILESRKDIHAALTSAIDAHGNAMSKCNSPQGKGPDAGWLARLKSKFSSSELAANKETIANYILYRQFQFANECTASTMKEAVFAETVFYDFERQYVKALQELLQKRGAAIVKKHSTLSQQLNDYQAILNKRSDHHTCLSKI